MCRKLLNTGLAALAVALLVPLFGCLNTGAARKFVIEGVTHEAWEFLLDNNTILDLFVDN